MEKKEIKINNLKNEIKEEKNQKNISSLKTNQKLNIDFENDEFVKKQMNDREQIEKLSKELLNDIFKIKKYTEIIKENENEDSQKDDINSEVNSNNNENDKMKKKKYLKQKEEIII